jgi:hypothetical protein
VSFPQSCHQPNFCPAEVPILLREGLGRKDGVKEEGARQGGPGILRGPLNMPSDMGVISLIGALCQVLCQQPDQFRCKNFKATEEDPFGSSMGTTS